MTDTACKDTESLISVIIPVYNTEDYLVRCLDSVIANTYQHLEIICIDDGSTDGSLRILEKYEKQDPRVRVIRQEHGGYCVARNCGLKAARGEYIAFIDSDDWICPACFSLLMKAHRLTSADIVIGGKENVSSTAAMADLLDMELKSCLSEITLDDVIGNEYWRTRIWGRLFTKSIIDGVRFDPSVQLEDVCFNYDVIFRQNGHLRFALIDAPLYYYCQRPGSTVHNLTPEMIKSQMIWFCNHASSTADSMAVKLSSIEALKSFLAYRYSLWAETRSHIGHRIYRNKISEAEALIRIPRENIRKSTQIPEKKKIQFAILYRLSGVYRRYRIIHDPTLLRWEREIRRRPI